MMWIALNVSDSLCSKFPVITTPNLTYIHWVFNLCGLGSTYVKWGVRIKSVLPHLAGSQNHCLAFRNREPYLLPLIFWSSRSDFRLPILHFFLVCKVLTSHPRQGLAFGRLWSRSPLGPFPKPIYSFIDSFTAEGMLSEMRLGEERDRCGRHLIHFNKIGIYLKSNRKTLEGFKQGRHHQILYSKHSCTVWKLGWRWERREKAH